MSWDEIIGQPLAVRRLRRLAAGHVAQSLLFSGPPGTGKRPAAVALAKALHCQNPPAPGDFCGTCVACRKVAAGNHPDLLTVEPAGKFIRIGQIVDKADSNFTPPHTPVRSFVARRPGESRWQVVIIDGAEHMNTESANALLKTLEEPPPPVVFILITHNPAALLPTIVSRCQLVHFPPLATTDIAEVLERDKGLDRSTAELLSALSGGSLGRAIHMVEDPAILAHRDAAGELVAALAQMDDHTALTTAEELEKRRDEVPELLEHLCIWLRDLAVWRQTQRRDLLLGTDSLDFIARESAGYTVDQLLEMLGAIGAAQQAIVRNANLRLVLDVLLLRLSAHRLQST